MAESNSGANYLNASKLFGDESGTKFPVDKIKPEVGQINALGGSTGFTSTTDLQKKQAESTTGGCGTSFTTATDPKNISVKHENPRSVGTTVGVTINQICVKSIS